ncbi:MAG: twin-arginine translocase subunit TatC [Verrucomicrobiota bacterium]
MREQSTRGKGADDGFDPEEKPFLDHLEDLRTMFLKIILTLVIGFGACFIFKKQLVDFIEMPMVWANIAEENAMKAIFDFGGNSEKEARFSPEDLVVTQGGMIGAVVEEDAKKGITSVELADGIVVRIKTASILGKIPSEEKDISPSDLLRLDKQKVLIMGTFQPAEGLVLVFKLVFFAGIILTIPFLIIFIMEFVLPGLRQAEKKAVFPALFGAVVLFLVGGAFAFRVGLPFALRFLTEWNYDHGMMPEWRIGYYMTFVTQVTLVFGLAFQLPVIVLVLVKLELLTYRSMRDSRSYAIVILLCIAALITPPDPITLLLLGGPLILLYEICIGLAYLLERKKRKLEAEEEKRREAERAELEARHAELVAEGKILENEDEEEEKSESTGYDHEGDLYHDDPHHHHEQGHGQLDPYHDPHHDWDHDHHHQDPHHQGVGTVGQIDINHASFEELQKLPGIGPKLAQQIMDARPFYSEEELEYHAYLPPSVIKLIVDRVTFY